MKKWLIAFLVVIVIAGAYNLIPEIKLPLDKKIDKLVVLKNQEIMEVYSDGEIIKTYNISLGANPTGDKQYEGDKRTPEGEYTIDSKNPNSTFYKNLGISYPNKADIEVAASRNVKSGGEIKIHGLRNGIGFIGKFHRLMNWTAGCIAVTNSEMDELYEHVPIGTPIIIKP